MKKKKSEELSVSQKRRMAAEKYKKEAAEDNVFFETEEKSEADNTLNELHEADEKQDFEEQESSADFSGELEIGNNPEESEELSEEDIKKKSKKKKRIIIITVVCTILLAMIATAFFAVRNFMKKELFGGSQQDVMLDDVKEGVYTCLLVATDKSKANTDTIMLLVMRYTDGIKQIDLISIPRDTRVVNPHSKSGHVKINSLVARNNGKIDTLVSEVRSITGIPINDFVLIDIEGVKKSVDMFGGVYFDVPMNMNYDDPVQDLHIHLNKGYQLIDGDKAEQLLRYRAGYPTADLGRTETQRAFLMEAFKQHAKISNLGKVVEWYSAMEGYVDTKMTGEEAYELAKVAVHDDFKLVSHILPGSTKDGSGDYFYDAEGAYELAKSLGFGDIKIKSTPKPSVNTNSGENFDSYEGPASDIPDEIPIVNEEPSDDENGEDIKEPSDDEEDENGESPEVSASPKPTPTVKPSASSKPTSSAKPTEKPDASESAKPSESVKPSAEPTPTAKPSESDDNSGEYPDGI